MFTEKIIQIFDDKALTNKGRIFQRFIGLDSKTFWSEIELPTFNEKQANIPKGKSKFIEPVSNQEKFDKANNINDLLNG